MADFPLGIDKINQFVRQIRLRARAAVFSLSAHQWLLGGLKGADIADDSGNHRKSNADSGDFRRMK